MTLESNSKLYAVDTLSEIQRVEYNDSNKFLLVINMLYLVL